MVEESDVYGLTGLRKTVPLLLNGLHLSLRQKSFTHEQVRSGSGIFHKRIPCIFESAETFAFELS